MSEILELRIDSLSSTGAGVARADGLVIFIDDVAPGDLVRARLREKRKTFALADLLEVIEPGAARRQPLCPVASECGGCQWQQVEYAEQLVQKSRIIRDALNRIAGIKWEKEVDVVASPDEFRYRNRIQVQAENGKVGYHAKKSHRLVEIQDCPLAEEGLVPKLKELRKSRATGRVELRLDGNEGFSQVNSRQNENLVRYVCELTAQLRFSAIYDFFCGSGNFSFPLKERHPGSPLIGVELSDSAIRQAGKRASTDGFKDMLFLAQDCGEFLEGNDLRSESLILLDPPRTGCDEKFLRVLSAKSSGPVIYISCNPATLARDLRVLRKFDPLWKLESVRGFDMFPQTAHVETVCLLTKTE